jgi:hypothetical protein
MMVLLSLTKSQNRDIPGGSPSSTRPRDRSFLRHGQFGRLEIVAIGASKPADVPGAGGIGLRAREQAKTQ